MTPGLYQRVIARARGVCECGCGLPLYNVEIDHFFGKAKAPENAETCWALRAGCHREKTDNRPSGPVWCEKFIVHAKKHGYAVSVALATRKLDWQRAKAGFAA